MSETWLTAEEVGEPTGLRPHSWCGQCRKLSKMGIAFRPKELGVHWSHMPNQMPPTAQLLPFFRRPARADGFRGGMHTVSDGTSRRL